MFDALLSAILLVLTAIGNVGEPQALEVIAPYRADYYVVDLCQEQAGCVRLQSDGASGLEVVILDDMLNLVARSGKAASSETVWFAPRSGRYFVVVRNPSDQEQQYSLAANGLVDEGPISAVSNLDLWTTPEFDSALLICSDEMPTVAELAATE